MKAKVLKLTGTRGIMVRRNFYVEVIIGIKTKDETNLEPIFINIKCGPDKMLGKMVLISKFEVAKYPMDDSRDIIITNDLELI